MTDDYKDIIDHQGYALKYHTPMSAVSRAAQFSAFAALTGYDEEIAETARLTESSKELTEDETAELNNVLYELSNRPYEDILVRVTYFKPDKRKNGGAYVDYEGVFRYYKVESGSLVFADNSEICINDILKAEMLL